MNKEKRIILTSTIEVDIFFCKEDFDSNEEFEKFSKYVQENKRKVFEDNKELVQEELKEKNYKHISSRVKVDEM